MNKLKILVKKAKSQSTGKEYFKYSTQNNDGRYIDVKFNSNNIDLKKLPEKTFIIYVKPEDVNLKNKVRDGAVVMSQKYEKPVQELWISAIDHFADQAEVDAEIAAYRAKRSAEVSAQFPQA